MRLYKYSVIFTPESARPETYNVSVPAFPEIATYGESLAEARFMAQDSLELVILSQLDEGKILPTDKKPSRFPQKALVEEILVTVSHDVRSTPLTHDVKTAFV